MTERAKTGKIKRCEICNCDILEHPPYNEEYLGDGTPGVGYAHVRCVNPNRQEDDEGEGGSVTADDKNVKCCFCGTIIGAMVKLYQGWCCLACFRSILYGR